MKKFTVVKRGLHSSGKLLEKSPALESIIRVDHAGELGADRIYAGQMAVLGKTKVGPVIQEMWDQEKHHKAKFEELIVKHRVRPTALTPFWNIAGFALGAGTALLGEKAAMACTVAVESVIVEHYNDQLRVLMANKSTDSELLETIKKFRDDEQEHHDCGIEHGAEQAPFYQALTQVIKFGCRAAISASKGLLSTPTSCSIVHCRNYSTKPKWDLVSALCLERKPIVTKPLTPFEEKYKKIVSELEFYNSKRSNHELRLEEDARRAEELKKNEHLDELDAALKQSGQDFEDAGADELSKFRFASRTGVDDVKSLERKLDMHLVLLTHFKLGNELVWGLPQSIRSEGETMRDAADRVLTSILGSSIHAKILGNAPFGFYKYKYPKDSKSDSVGAKLFFFKAIYESGTIELNKDLALDYQWATRWEMEKIVKKEEYLSSIQAFLIDEPHEEETPAVKRSIKS